ncbi:unnamed protein product [Macrosiphum euphorbiae]|nr:unnamed protein product [Macrosiphum euphorbiae]
MSTYPVYNTGENGLTIKGNWLLNLDDLVLIKEPTAPLHWHLGRIVKLHPGSDGVSRVATVRTATGLLTRPAVKLCPLPSP